MKWLLGLFALGGLVALISTSSCGPSRPFCPTHPPDFSCFDTDGNVIGGTMGTMDDPCDGKAPIYCNGKPICATACP